MPANQSSFILKTPRDDYEPNTNGLGCELFYCMKLNRNKLAQFIVETDEKDTYGSLLQRSIRTAIKLRNQKLNYGDVISLCSYNHKDTAIPMIASLFLGLTFSPLDRLLSIDQIMHLLSITKPKIIFATSDTVDLLEKAVQKLNLETKLVIFGTSTKHEEFSSYLESQENEAEFEPIPAKSVKDTALIYFSSGSTGAPKGICLSHYALMAQTVIAIKAEKMGSIQLSNYTHQSTENGVIWIMSSYYWISAPFHLISCTFAGIPRVINRELNPKQFWSIIEKYQVTHMTWLVMLASLLSNLCEGLPAQTTSLKSVLIGGSKSPDQVYKNLRECYPSVYFRPVYAMTETSGPICFQHYDKKNLDIDRNNYGKITGDFLIKIVDLTTGKASPQTQAGELRLKSPYLMNGYHEINPEGVYDEDGFFCTGDIVCFDENQNLYFIERVKELIKYRGYHISPGFLENILVSIPGVARAAVIGVSVEEDDEHPKAFVQLKENFSATPEEIRKFVDEKVCEMHKLRGGVVIVDHLPLTPSDKVNRAELRKLYAKKS